MEVDPAAMLRTLNGRVRAVAQPYSGDDRELALLLFVPFLLVATAILINQSIRQSAVELEPVALDAPLDVLPYGVAAQRLAIARVPSVALAPRAPELGVLEPLQRADSVLADAGARDRLPAVASLGETAREAPFEVQEPEPARLGQALEPAPAERLALLPVSPPTLMALPEPYAEHEAVCRPDEKPRLAALTLPLPQTPEEFGLGLAKAAEAQAEAFVVYNDKYRAIAYPNGDVPALFGVCTDVIVRAYRVLGVDLQARVQEARVGKGDRNIDHRRTEVLRLFFAKKGLSLPLSPFAEDYQPGDIVTYYRPQNSGSRSHIAIVSSVIAPSGRPMIVHNRGWGPQLEDGLFVDQITGHYRYWGADRTFAPVRETSRDNRAHLRGAENSQRVVSPAALMRTTDTQSSIGLSQ